MGRERRRRRLPRLLLNAATAVSFLLCVATVALWVRSYWWPDSAGWREPRGQLSNGQFLQFESGAGGVAFSGGNSWAYSPLRSARRFEGWFWRSAGHRPISYPGFPPANRWGFGYTHYRHPMTRYRILIIPIPLLAALFALAPVAHIASAIRRRRRRSPGLCPACGYDLRATPDRCPECGMAAAHEPRSS